MNDDISITSPTAELLSATPEALKKAKLRLETVCLLLAERTNNSQLIDESRLARSQQEREK